MSSRFTRKTTLPKAPRRLEVGYNPVIIAGITKPVEIEIEGEERYTTKATFRNKHSDAELSLDCICYLSQGSRLTQIFEATHAEFDLDSDDEDWCLEDLLNQELIVLVEEKESANGKIYRSIAEFLPADAEVKLVE